jgi:gas vesicle protein
MADSTPTQRKKQGRGLTFLGLLTGAAIGAAVALIYSPSDGEKNRQQLNRWAGHRLDDLQNRVGIK